MVIGDFSTPEMVALVKEKYSGYPAGQLPHSQTIQLTSPKSLRIIRANGIGKFPNDRVYLNIGYVLPPPTSEDFQALEMLTEFLGGKETSRLKMLFKQEEYTDWVNTISASIDFNRDFSTLQISAELPLDSDVERTVELITQTVKGMADEPLSEEKLESALISHVTGEIYLQEKTPLLPDDESLVLNGDRSLFSTRWHRKNSALLHHKPSRAWRKNTCSIIFPSLR